MNGFSQNKAECRKQAKLLREALDWQALSHGVCQQLSEWPVFQQAKTVLLFSAKSHELDVMPLCPAFRNKTWGLPRVTDDNLVFHAYQHGDRLIERPFGIGEPLETQPAIDIQTADLIILPALLADSQGIRLGYGKGFYDRALSGLSGKPHTAIIIPEACLTEALPQDPWDITAHSVVTETRILSI